MDKWDMEYAKRMRLDQPEPVKEVIRVDGSFGEGGGQIIRNSIAYACLLRRSIEVFNIRANRPNPGLASQHLESILALKRLTGFKTGQFLSKGIKNFDLDCTAIPQPTAPSSASTVYQTRIDLKTAGSISLCIQCILPYLLHLKSASKVTIIGGTHVLKAPSYDYLSRVFVPMVNRWLGFEIGVKLIRPGYFPKGGGQVEIKTEPMDSFNRFQILERGPIKKSTVILNTPPWVTSNDLEELKNRLTNVTFGGIYNLELRKVPYASLEILLEFEHTFSGFSSVVEGRKPTLKDFLDKMEEIIKGYEEFMDSDAPVDPYLADQLILYMGLTRFDLSNGNVMFTDDEGSALKTTRLTDHSYSAMHVAELFSDACFKFRVENTGKSDIVKL